MKPFNIDVQYKKIKYILYFLLFFKYVYKLFIQFNETAVSEYTEGESSLFRSNGIFHRMF